MWNVVRLVDCMCNTLCALALTIMFLRYLLLNEKVNIQSENEKNISMLYVWHNYEIWYLRSGVIELTKSVPNVMSLH